MPLLSQPLRVLVLDDDLVFRHILVKAFDKVAGAQIVGSVATIAAAKNRIEAGDVDLVTIDVVLAEGSGLSILPWLSSKHPKVIAVLITAGTEKRASQEIDAILLGASKLLIKPSGIDAAAQLQARLSEIVANLRVKHILTPATVALDPVFPALRSIIGIGASTGGPPVLLQLMRGLPSSFMVPILVTQHLAAQHMPSFVDMLKYPGARPVAVGLHGSLVMPGHVYLAGNDRHLKVVNDGGRLRMVQDESPEENFSRPAVDPMFRSIAEACGATAVGMVVTGMGADGAKGSLALRAQRAPVVAQDQASSVVWGMPGAVVAAKAANAIVPASELVATIMRWTTGYQATLPGVKR